MLKRLTSSRIQQVQPNKPTQTRSSFMPLVNPEWKQIKTSSNLIKKRSHHSAAVVDSRMYIYGGYEVSRNGCGVLGDFFSYDFAMEKWVQLDGSSDDQNPGKLHSHSCIEYQRSLYLFGGIFNTFESTNRVFRYQVDSAQWKQLKTKGAQSERPPCLSSHAAAVYENQMIIFGGEFSTKYNDKVYSLNLSTLEWRVIAVLDDAKGSSPSTRTQCSICVNKDKLYIFGGKKDDGKFNDLWSLDLKANNFTRIHTEKYFTPMGRSGHSATIYEGNLLIFGGTTGVTHERNDLIFYNIRENCWRRHWQDSQSSRNEERDTSRSNSVKKVAPNSSFSGSNKNDNGENSQSRVGKMTESRTETPEDPNKKYRKQMKQDNYYNENYHFYGEKVGGCNSKHKKNDLLLDLERESKDDNHKSQLNDKKPNEASKLSQTFESLSLSILSGFVGGKGLRPNAELLEDKNSQEKLCRVPKARDGHTVCLLGDKMVVFGGDRHHMAYNDIVVIDLPKVTSLSMQSKNFRRQPLEKKVPLSKIQSSESQQVDEEEEPQRPEGQTNLGVLA